MQPLYPYFAIYRGAKKTDELLKYIYSHAQALCEIQRANEDVKEQSLNVLDTHMANIKHNDKLVCTIKSNIEAYLKGRE
jgi:hypothetical protein